MAQSQIQHFLLVFDHSKGRLQDERPFGSDADAALAAYAECERKFKDRPEIEIVLIGSDSLATVRRTHANYYDGTVVVSKYLAGI